MYNYYSKNFTLNLTGITFQAEIILGDNKQDLNKFQSGKL
jgi:hypothetical protein